MPIPPAEIARIKKSTDLPSLVTSQGIPLTRMGKDLAGKCPFHEDDSPSLKLTEKPEGWLYHCFGCGRGGDCYTWVMELEGVEFPAAHEMLNNGYIKGDREVSRLLTCPVTADMSASEMLQRITEYYHQILLSPAGEAAKAYLKERGIYNEEMIRKFKIGFCDRSLGKKLPSKNRADGALIRKTLSDLGILRKNSGHEHFRGCLIIPIISGAGEVTEIYGRKIAKNHRSGTPLHLYLPGPHRGIWNPECLQGDTIILCESLIDAFTWICNGFPGATSTYGAGGLTDEMIEEFKSHKTKAVYMSQDSDEAGDSAAERVSKRLAEIGTESYRVTFPKGMDANEYALKVQPARKSLEMVLQKAAKMDKQGAMSNVSKISLPPSELPGDGHGQKDGGDFSIKGAAKEEENFTPSQSPPEQERVARQENTHSPATPQSEEKPPEPNKQPSPLDAPSPINPLVEVKDEVIHITLGDRVYRVLGLYQNHSLGTMKVTLRVKGGDKQHIDQIDLCNDNKREAFIRKASKKLDLEEEIIESDISKILSELDCIQESHLEGLKNPQKEPEYKMTEEEEKEAIAFLRSPNLLDLIAKHFIILGIVGETVNCKILYLGVTSRLLKKPLSIMIQSLFAAGKSALMEAVLKLLPKECKITYTAVTGQALFYMNEPDKLKHKILAIAEEEGLEKVKYALKNLQSEGKISIASTCRDPHTGDLVARPYDTEGPVGVIFTGTSADFDEELLSRCFSLSMDLSQKQTRAIHEMQRKMETLEGLEMEIEQKKIIQLHQNVQRLLKPILVKNPFAKELKFTDKCHRTRRDHIKYLTLIQAIALLHQYQRPIKKMKKDGIEVPYIEVTLEDIGTANALCNEVLGQSLSDLTPQIKKLLELIHQMVQKECEKQSIGQELCLFTRRQIQEYTGWSHSQLKAYIPPLVEREYLILHKKQHGSSDLYELFYRGEGEKTPKFMLGLIDIEELRKKMNDQNDDDKNPQKHEYDS